MLMETGRQWKGCWPEMSIGLDLDWTGSGLWRILLILDWIRPVKCFINLGSGPDLDWVNGKNYIRFFIKKLYSVNCLDYNWTWIGNILNYFGLWLDLDWVLKIQDWIWIAKCDSPLFSAADQRHGNQGCQVGPFGAKGQISENSSQITLAGPKIFVWPFGSFLAFFQDRLTPCKN